VSRVLVLGGSRSGKSAFAESLLADAADVVYVATAAERPDDAEWMQRITAHRDRRPSDWTTVETGELATVLAADGPPVLIDSITSWLARLMDESGYWTTAPAEVPPAAHSEWAEQFCSLWGSTQRRAVAVSDEVGSGIVPETVSGRRFRDALGELNQRLAATADEVHLVVAGIALRLK
jgi:adenosylcobinamide kinase / adenosylcobinamide-phosphate guanylyltransferase